MPKVITYKCSQCGATVVVTKDLDTQISPIYCCGEEALAVSEKEVSAEELKQAAEAPTAQKTVKKKTAKKSACKKSAKKKARSKKTKK